MFYTIHTTHEHIFPYIPYATETTTTTNNIKSWITTGKRTWTNEEIFLEFFAFSIIRQHFSVCKVNTPNAKHKHTSEEEAEIESLSKHKSKHNIHWWIYKLHRNLHSSFNMSIISCEQNWNSSIELIIFERTQDINLSKLICTWTICTRFFE